MILLVLVFASNFVFTWLISIVPLVLAPLVKTRLKLSITYFLNAKFKYMNRFAKSNLPKKAFTKI